jgi:hypothetical protein
MIILAAGSARGGVRVVLLLSMRGELVASPGRSWALPDVWWGRRLHAGAGQRGCRPPLSDRVRGSAEAQKRRSATSTPTSIATTSGAKRTATRPEAGRIGMAVLQVERFADGYLTHRDAESDQMFGYDGWSRHGSRGRSLLPLSPPDAREGALLVVRVFMRWLAGIGRGCVAQRRACANVTSRPLGSS